MAEKGLLARTKDGELTFVIAVLVMLIIPIHYRYLPPIMVLLVLAWIFENHTTIRITSGNFSNYQVLLFLFFAFYVMQLISILYTSDVKLGWLNLFGRLSIIVFPLVLFNPGNKIKTNTTVLLRLFTLATSIFITACFLFALFRSLSIKDGLWLFNPILPDSYWLNYFYGADLTFSIHPSYLAMFVLISTFISFETFYDNSLNLKYRICWFFLGIFLFISIYFISSRAGILAAILMIVFYAVHKIVKVRKYSFLWLGIIFILTLLLPLIRNNDKVNTLISGLADENFTLKRQDERLIVWEAAVKLIRKNPVLGVGIGDVRSELTKEYIQAGEVKLSKEKLNAHNQYLETFLEGGFVEFAIFLSMLGFMIFIAISEKNLLYGLFIIMMIVFFTFETVLYRLAGVAFFSLFSFILLRNHQQHPVENPGS